MAPVEAEATVDDARRAALEQPWKKVGGVAVPTLLLTLFVTVAAGVTTYGAVTGVLPLAVVMPVHSFWAYLAFTAGHEASHGNLVGSRRDLEWLELAVGWLTFTMLALPYSMFKYLHLKHHSLTNDPEQDPDYRASGSSLLTVVVHCWTVQLGYARVLRAHLVKGSPGAREALHGVWAYTAASVTLLLAAIHFGFWKWIFLLWVIPAGFAQGFLALVFDWLPHHPHTSRERYRDTRVILFPGLETLLLGQNYHLIHHLFPRLPFYRYSRCFREIRELLVAKRSPIHGKSRRFSPSASSTPS